jgi:hypothetical protein
LQSKVAEIVTGAAAAVDDSTISTEEQVFHEDLVVNIPGERCARNVSATLPFVKIDGGRLNWLPPRLTDLFTCSVFKPCIFFKKVSGKSPFHGIDKGIEQKRL